MIRKTNHVEPLLTLANLCVIALLAVGVSWNSGASAAVIAFSNSSAITIPAAGTAGIASPFPSIINVAGLSGVIDVDATLLGLSHTFSGDLEMVLEGPGGQRVRLMNDEGGGNNWTADDVTFSDGAPALIGSSPGASGTFSPSGNLAQCGFAQCTGAGTLLSVFNGLDPNGAWKLYINDDATLDIGTVSNGWRLTFTTAEVPEPATLALLGLALAGLGLAHRRKLH